MSYRVEFTKPAAKALGKLPSDVAKRILDATDKLADDPTPAGVKPLKGSKGVYRIRIGDYRVLYEVERARLVVVVIDVGNRREVYR